MPPSKPSDAGPATAALPTHLRTEFSRRFGRSPRVFFAPGRANLIGAHLDYNGGAVLPVPLRNGTYVAMAPSRDGLLRFASLDVDGDATVRPQSVPPPQQLGWAAYPCGVWFEARRRGLRLQPVEMLVAGDLPRRSGLSSSASLEVATAFALATLGDWPLSRQDLAELAYEVENGYVGVKCGIMDQFASALAKPGHALHLRCASRQWRHVPVQAACDLVVLDTNKPRELVASEFNKRVEQCQRALRVLRRHDPSKSVLAEFDLPAIEAARAELGELSFRRARHVATESLRVERAVRALEGDDLETLGQCVRESHQSAAHDYEVSCPELDFLAERAGQVPGVYGARLTGAGFGGCVLALQRPGALDAPTTQLILADYRARFGLEGRVLELRLGDGPREVVEA